MPRQMGIKRIGRNSATTCESYVYWLKHLYYPSCFLELPIGECNRYTPLEQEEDGPAEDEPQATNSC